MDTTLPQYPSAPAVVVPEHVLRSVAACVAEVLHMRHHLSEHAFSRDTHAQYMVGYVKGVAFGLGIEQNDLVTQATRLLENLKDLDTLWCARPS